MKRGENSKSKGPEAGVVGGMGEGKIEVTAHGAGVIWVYSESGGGRILEQRSRDWIRDLSRVFLLWFGTEQVIQLCWPYCSSCKMGKVMFPERLCPPHFLFSISVLG